MSLPRRPPSADATHGATLCATLTDSDLHFPSARVPTPRWTCHPSPWVFTQTCCPPTAQDQLPPAESDQTTSNTDSDGGRRGMLRPTAYGPGASATMTTSRIHRVLRQDIHNKPPASTSHGISSRPLTDSDRETQTDQTTKAATQSAIWRRHQYEPRPS